MFLHVIIFLASKRNSCKLQIYIKTVVVNSPSIIIFVEISIPQSNSFFYINLQEEIMLFGFYYVFHDKMPEFNQLIVKGSLKISHVK